MGEENISHEFRLKNIEEINNCFIKEIDQNELMSNKPKMVGTTFNYTENFNNLDLQLLDVFQFLLPLLYLELRVLQ